MIRTSAITIAAVAALGGSAAAEDARSVVEEASRAMGVTGLDSIAFAGTATYGNIGQSRRISFGLASITIGNFTRTIDFAHSAMHTAGVAGSPAVPGNPAPGFLEEIVASTDGRSAQLDIWMTPWGFLRGAATLPATVKSEKIEGGQGAGAHGAAPDVDGNLRRRGDDGQHQSAAARVVDEAGGAAA